MYKLEFGEELLLLFYYLQKDTQRPGSHLYKRALWSRHDPWERKKSRNSALTHAHTTREESIRLFSILTPLIRGEGIL